MLSLRSLDVFNISHPGPWSLATATLIADLATVASTIKENSSPNAWFSSMLVWFPRNLSKPCLCYLSDDSCTPFLFIFSVLLADMQQLYMLLQVEMHPRRPLTHSNTLWNLRIELQNSCWLPPMLLHKSSRCLPWTDPIQNGPSIYQILEPYLRVISTTATKVALGWYSIGFFSQFLHQAHTFHK